MAIHKAGFNLPSSGVLPALLEERERGAPRLGS